MNYPLIPYKICEKMSLILGRNSAKQKTSVTSKFLKNLETLPLSFSVGALALSFKAQQLIKTKTSFKNICFGRVSLRNTFVIIQ